MYKEKYGPWAFIAGGSEGVGASYARKLAADGINVILAARKKEPLDDLAAELRGAFGVDVRVLALDLRNPDLLQQVRSATDDLEVGMLIYNAGADSVIREFVDREVEDAERMIGLNVIAPVQLAHHFASGMRQRRRGGIIIVGSNACHAGGAKILVYSAVKAFEHTFAEGLWYELRPHGIDVIGLILGATKTPAMKRMGINFDAPGSNAAEPDDVAQQGLDHLGVDPIWCVAGTGEFAQQLRAMSRAEAVTLIAQGIEATNS